MTKLTDTTKINRCGFTLAEVIIVIGIAGMISVSSLAIYNRVKRASDAIDRNLAEGTIPAEILQRFTEDLDRMAIPDFDTRLILANKRHDGFVISQLTIENKIYNKSNKPATFAKVIWQSDYNFIDDRIIIYRSHSGIAMEDRLIESSVRDDNPIENPAEELFVPLASGVSYFKIQALDNGKVVDAWTSSKLPSAIRVGISFAPLYETMSGGYEVDEVDIITRTISLNRTKDIPYVFTKEKLNIGDLDDTDPNFMSNGDPNNMSNGGLQ
jgi:prepilin-type N-terminal cleavage/methylation domain-containing protein